MKIPDISANGSFEVEVPDHLRDRGSATDEAPDPFRPASDNQPRVRHNPAYLFTATMSQAAGDNPSPQIQPCRYKVGKTLGAGSYSVVKECVHIDTGRYYAAKVINKKLMAGREHMVR